MLLKTGKIFLERLGLAHLGAIAKVVDFALYLAHPANRVTSRVVVEFAADFRFCVLGELLHRILQLGRKRLRAFNFRLHTLESLFGHFLRGQARLFRRRNFFCGPLVTRRVEIRSDGSSDRRERPPRALRDRNWKRCAHFRGHLWLRRNFDGVCDRRAGKSIL